jgi:hypothetical protein
MRAAPRCGECDTEDATTLCEDCADLYCDACFVEMHRRGNRRTHRFRMIDEDEPEDAMGLPSTPRDHRPGEQQHQNQQHQNQHQHQQQQQQHIHEDHDRHGSRQHLEPAPAVVPDGQTFRPCDRHPTENLDLACEDCAAIVCAHCVLLGPHRGHTYRPAADAAQEVRGKCEVALAEVDRRCKVTIALRTSLEDTRGEVQSTCRRAADALNIALASSTEALNRFQQDIFATYVVGERKRKKKEEKKNRPSSYGLQLPGFPDSPPASYSTPTTLTIKCCPSAVGPTSAHSLDRAASEVIHGCSSRAPGVLGRIEKIERVITLTSELEEDASHLEHRYARANFSMLSDIFCVFLFFFSIKTCTHITMHAGPCCSAPDGRRAFSLIFLQQRTPSMPSIPGPTKSMWRGCGGHGEKKKEKKKKTITIITKKTNHINPRPSFVPKSPQRVIADRHRRGAGPCARGGAGAV